MVASIPCISVAKDGDTIKCTGVRHHQMEKKIDHPMV
jgi:hypothetical protein